MVRAALPCTLQCNTCRSTVVRGKKLYMNKRRSKQGLVFTFRCPQCAAPLSFVAALSEGRYVAGEGATQIGPSAQNTPVEQPPLKRLRDELLVPVVASKYFGQSEQRPSDEAILRQYVQKCAALQGDVHGEDTGDGAEVDTKYRALTFFFGEEDDTT